jgi:shikimate kinase
MKIVLVGYMAAGKSSIARRIARLLNLNFYDLDNVVEDREQKTIPEIFKDNGENYFRELETKYLLEILHEKNNFVLATGGGTPCFKQNLEIILEKTLCIYIKLSNKALVNRIINSKKSRPLVDKLSESELLEFVEKHLSEREVFYNKSHIIVNGFNIDYNLLIKDILEESKN